VKAQEGGYDFNESTYNRAVQACREPGSAFKPIVYSAAIDKLDYNASTMIDDKPLIFDDPDNAVRWKPDNAGQEFRGQLPLRTCLKDSINTAAIRVADAVGIVDVMKNARRLGLTTPLKRELGTAIGSSCTTLLDLVTVYVTLHQYGVRRDLQFIRRIVDRYGNVWKTTPCRGIQRSICTAARPRLCALGHTGAPSARSQTAFLMLKLLEDAVREGTGIAASRTGNVVAGKTGTTNDSYDAWFMGMTRSLLTGVWVGHDKKERPLGSRSRAGVRRCQSGWILRSRR